MYQKDGTGWQTTQTVGSDGRAVCSNRGVPVENIGKDILPLTVDERKRLTDKVERLEELLG